MKKPRARAKVRIPGFAGSPTKGIVVGPFNTQKKGAAFLWGSPKKKRAPKRLKA